jgi:hypothetical protein
MRTGYSLQKIGSGNSFGSANFNRFCKRLGEPKSATKFHPSGQSEYLAAGIGELLLQACLAVHQLRNLLAL